jgi:hypothetical protein
MPFGNCSAFECVAVTAARIRVPGPDRAATPAAGRTRRGPRPRTLPTGFSRGQAHLLGRLHTDSRHSDGHTDTPVEPPGGSGRFAPETLRSRPLRSHEKCAERVVAAVCRRQLSDGTTPLPRFACLRPSLYPDRRVPEEYRVEAHFSGVRRRVFGGKWPDPPGLENSNGRGVWHRDRGPKGPALTHD